MSLKTIQMNLSQKTCDRVQTMFELLDFRSKADVVGEAIQMIHDIFIATQQKGGDTTITYSDGTKEMICFNYRNKGGKETDVK